MKRYMTLQLVEADPKASYSNSWGNVYLACDVDAALAPRSTERGGG